MTKISRVLDIFRHFSPQSFLGLLLQIGYALHGALVDSIWLILWSLLNTLVQAPGKEESQVTTQPPLYPLQDCNPLLLKESLVKYGSWQTGVWRHSSHYKYTHVERIHRVWIVFIRGQINRRKYSWHLHHSLCFINRQVRELVWFNTSALDTGCCFNIVFSFYKFFI